MESTPPHQVPLGSGENAVVEKYFWYIKVCVYVRTQINFFTWKLPIKHKVFKKISRFDDPEILHSYIKGLEEQYPNEKGFLTQFYIWHW